MEVEPVYRPLEAYNTWATSPVKYKEQKLISELTKPSKGFSVLYYEVKHGKFVKHELVKEAGKIDYKL